MSFTIGFPLSRRSLIKAVSAGVATLSAPGILTNTAHAIETREFALRAAPGQANLRPGAGGQTAIWSYNGAVPGPEIRVRQGERLRITVQNELAEETTVHWHGVRLPNAMDGVPHLTQRPIASGASFVYEFDAVDAGTFWYHPHQRSFEQVGRGLYGALIVEETEPLHVDRDVTWVLDDWRLTGSAEISNDFGNGHDMSHGGRVGNTVTINGAVPDAFAVRSGERIRLRLINAANARIFALEFQGHRPSIIALDGQPVTPHEPESGLVVLGPAMRVDLVLDMSGEPGSRTSITDRFYKGLEYRLIDLAYGSIPIRETVPDWPIALPANPLPEPDTSAAHHHDVFFNGGMMGQMVMREMGGSMGQGGSGGMMNMMRGGGIWFINGRAAEGHVLEPMLTLARGEHHVFAMTNATAWHHPMHLHGHSFRVISRNGASTAHAEWQDTVLVAPREKVEIAFVADNPGDWMFHCHILEHQAAGMMGVVRVT